MAEKIIRGKYLPEFVYGGIDGSVTTFAVVAGAVGASLSPSIILILGFANLFADGFSMSIASYLSAKSQQDLHYNHKENPIKTGMATLISFILIGFIPLFSFVASLLFPSMQETKFILSFILTGAAFLSIGAIKGIVVKKHPLLASLETFIIGSIAAILAFAVGYMLRNIGA